MTLDEQITILEHNAEYERTHGSLQGCLEFRQLAEWLTELKHLREQTEPCEDAISRQAAYQELSLLLSDWDDDYNKVVSKCLKAIDNVPSVQPEQRWIPVSEKLPICEQEVLVCAERRYVNGNTKMIITPAFYEDGTLSEVDSSWSWEDLDCEKWDDENDCRIIPEGWWENRHYNPDGVYNNLIDDHILAWMPLPEHYKEEGE